MKKIGILVMLCMLLNACKNEVSTIKSQRSFKTVSIEHLLQDSLLNVRALEIDKNGAFAFATSKGEIGGKTYGFSGEKVYANSTNEDVRAKASLSLQLQHDSLIPNFRALAITKWGGFVLGIGNPALLYRVDQEDIQLVYKEVHDKVFYDAIDFWNDQEGIAIGDPTADCMSIIITRDGGQTWQKVSCNDLPKTKDGEAAFAASDTNIAIVGDHTWVATGGMSSRVLYSPDKGNTWTVYETPIIQGKPTTGIYSIDFYDAFNGFAVGGDYTNPEANSANKIRTTDGGKTWQIVGADKIPGYRSCVQYVPNSNGKELVVVGFNGIDYSNDAGSTWKHLSDEGYYTIRFLNDSIAYVAGKGRVSKLTFKE